MDFYNFFSFSAKKAIFRASEICVQFNTQYLEPEHIFFSILNLHDCSAVQALHNFDVNIPELNGSLEAYLYEHAGSFKGTATFSARTLTLFDKAYKETRHRKHREIGTMHLLIALADDKSPFLQSLFTELDLTAKKLTRTFRGRLTNPPTGEDQLTATSVKTQMTYDHEVTEILRLARYLARRLRHPRVELCHVMYALTTREGALSHVRRYWKLGPLRPSRVLVRLAEAIDTLEYAEKVDSSGLDDEVISVLTETLKHTRKVPGYTSVEFAEFLYVLLDAAEDQFKPLLAECVEQSGESEEGAGEPGQT